MKYFTGINIQFPISQKILSGEKTIETRTYPIPKKYIGVELLIIETPGKKGKFKARIVGKIIFSNSFKYSSKKRFQMDFDRHKVEKGSIWDWKDKAKFGWEISSITPLKNPIQMNKRKGILFTNNIYFPF